MSTLPGEDHGDRRLHFASIAQLKDELPWLELFRSFRIAIDYQKMAVSFLAVIIWMGGSFALQETLWSPGITRNGGRSVESWNTVTLLRRTVGLIDVSEQEQSFRTGHDHPLREFCLESNRVTWAFDRITQQLLKVLLIRDSGAWWYAWCELFWALVVSVLFGGAVARMVAREFVGDGRSMMRDVQFAIARFPSIFCTPVIALLCFAFFWGLCYLSGMLGRLPLIGEIGLSVLWFVLLIFGLIMALVSIGLFFGWPLMISSGAIESNDSFDALSRSFSYLLNRTWYAVYLILLSLIYGSILLLFVTWVTRLAAMCVIMAVESGLGRETHFWGIPTLLEMSNAQAELWTNPITEAIGGAWMSGVMAIPVAFAFSYFWTATSITYLLLRRREDGTPLKEINRSDTADSQGAGVPLVGIPAAEKREADRRGQVDGKGE